MNYYKLARGKSVFGVATSDDLRKHQKKHNVFLPATDAEAECVQLGDDFYRDKWMRTVDESVGEKVTIRAISEEEYATLSEALAEGVELDAAVEQANEEAIEEETPEIIVGEDTVELIRENKIKELSLACNRAITDGFELSLSGKTQHFSLSMQDQANLLAIQVQILTGETEIAYHADGEDSRLFSAEEMARVIRAANDHKTRHLVYFNSLKKYAESLKRASKIRDIEYGCQIPKRYQTALLKALSER